MDEDQQRDLDQQVQQVMQELTDAGERVTAESVRQRVGKRMHDVLAAIHRVTGMGPSEPDPDVAAEDYPEVVSAQAMVERLIQALAEAEQRLRDAEATYAAVELQAAVATVEGHDPPSLVAEREAMSLAAEAAHLLARALDVAKQRHAEALSVAQAQHWQRQWQGYQRDVAAFDVALSQAYAAQQVALATWNRIGQPGEPALLKGPLSIYPTDFHPFLQAMILDMAPEQVQRGAVFALEAGRGLPPRPY